jgi:hypothetical protein
MSNWLTFRCIAYDTGSIPSSIPKGFSVDFFKDVHEGAQSVSNEEEKKIIRWFFEQPLLKKLFYEELKIEQTLPFKLEVKEPIISNPNKKPGDIDILICDKNNPHHAIAMQGKRIKAKVEKNGNEKVNKIGDIKDAILQVNAMREMGFYNSYLALFIEMDGREREDSNFFFRGLNDQNFKRLYNFPQRERLHDDVGIVFIEIVQPIDRSINRSGMVCICVDKKAEPLSQPTNLTNRVIQLCK